jgi:hypothetical protein
MKIFTKGTTKLRDGFSFILALFIVSVGLALPGFTLGVKQEWSLWQLLMAAVISWIILAVVGFCLGMFAWGASGPRWFPTFRKPPWTTIFIFQHTSNNIIKTKCPHFVFR